MSDPYLPDSLEAKIDEIYREGLPYNLGPSKDEYRDLEVRALCRIADHLTTLTTLEMNR